MSTFFYMLLAGFAWMALRQSIELSTFLVGAAIGALVWRSVGGRARAPTLRQIPAPMSAPTRKVESSMLWRRAIHAKPARSM